MADAVAITDTPNERVSGLSVDRKGTTIETKWKNPSSATKDSNKRRFTENQVYIYMDYNDSRKKHTKVDVWKHPGTSGKYHGLGYTAAEEFWCKGLGLITSFSKKYDRKRYYPFKNSKGEPLPGCDKITIGVAGANGKGDGKWEYASYSFKTPKEPEVAIKFDSSKNKATVTVKSDEGKGHYERYDTMVRILVDDATGKTQAGKKDKVYWHTVLPWTSTRDTKYEKTIDISGYLKDLGGDDDIVIRAEAYCRGIRGDSKHATKNYTLGYPAKATIESVELVGGLNAKGIIKILYKSGKRTKKLQLQRSLSGSGSWTDVSGQVDDYTSGTLAFFDSYGDANPAPGEYVYYRIASTNDNDYKIYSDSFLAKCLYKEKSAAKTDARQEFISAIPGEDGTTVEAVMAFSDSWNTYRNTQIEYNRQAIPGLAADYKYIVKSRIPIATNSLVKLNQKLSLAYNISENDGYADFYCSKIYLASAKNDAQAKTAQGLISRVQLVLDNKQVYDGVPAWDSKSLVNKISYTKTFKRGTKDATHVLNILVLLNEGGRVEGRGNITFTIPKAPAGAKYYENKSVKDKSFSYANVGTELSYSTSLLDWTAINLEPEILDVVPVDSKTDKRATAKGYEKSQTVTIGNLEPDTTYYLKMRRYRFSPGSSDKVYADYTSATVKTSPSEKNKCGIISVTEGEEGSGNDKIHVLYVKVGILEKKVAYAGTELTISESKSAWSSSNAGYTAYEYSAEPQPATGNDAKIWRQTVTLTIQNVEAGKTYYLRARRFSSGSGSSKVYTAYSDIYPRTTMTAENDTCVINVVPLSGGTVVRLDIDIDEDNTNTGTEIQWSDYQNAWESNTSPDSLFATWPLAGKRQTAYIRNLTPGSQYWVRARRYLTSGQTTTNSPWCEMQTFITARDTAADDVCRIINTEVESSGTSAVITIGYTENNANVATEISWSTDENAWTSNKSPNTMEADWTDDESSSEDYKHTQVVHIRDLDLNKTYYFKARRYNEDEAGKTWTPYSDTVIVTTPAKSENYDIRCGFISADPMTDGTTVAVVVGWDGDHTGCEISWSDDERSWKASKTPSTFSFDWEDAENASQTYLATEDTEIDPDKTYYIIDGDETVAVEDPDAEHLDEYFELQYTWPHTGTCFISDLVEGTTYYMRARSYYENESGTSYSEYTTDVTVTPISTPDSVVLSSYDSVFVGDPIECWWSIGSEMEQTDWHIFAIDYSVDPPLFDTTSPLLSGEGSLCRASIPAEIYGDASTFSFYVAVSCGGGYGSSDPLTVGIARMPNIELSAESIQTEQPVSFEIYTDILNAGSITACYADGIRASRPDQVVEQFENDTIWSASGFPAWSETTWSDTALYSHIQTALSDAAAEKEAADAAFQDTDEYAAMVEAADILEPLLPGDEGYDEALASYESAREIAYATEAGIVSANADSAYEDAQSASDSHSADDAVYKATITIPNSELLDGASYTISAKPIEPIYGHIGEAVTGHFSMEYQHQAPEPSESIVVVPNNDERSVKIYLNPPANAAETDVYDVYRRTPEGFELVMDGMELDGIVEDRFAPYGHADLSYCVATRTEDGDVDWAEFPYKMNVQALRFDWDGKYVELPWNIGLTKTYKKDFEGRGKLNGDIHGRWDQDVAKTGSYTTQIIRVTDSELLRQLEEMASYPGPIWVRDGYGQAMECNVDLSNVSIDNLSLVVSLSLDITQVKMTEDFKASRYTEGGEEEEGND